jgi:hypothetical protein
MTRKYIRKNSPVRRSQKRRGGLSTKGLRNIGLADGYIALGTTAAAVGIGAISAISVLASGYTGNTALIVSLPSTSASLSLGTVSSTLAPALAPAIASYTYLAPVVLGLSVATGIPTAGIVPIGVVGVAAAGVIVYFTQKELRALIKRHCYADAVLNHFSVFIKCKYNKRVLNEVFNSVITKYKENAIFAKMKHGKYAKPLELLDYGIYIPNFFIDFEDFYSDAKLFKMMEIGGVNDENYEKFIKDPKMRDIIKRMNKIIQESENLYKKIENESDNYRYREELTDIIDYVIDERGLFFDIYKKRINKFAENRVQISKSSNIQATVNDNWNSFIHFFVQSVSIQNQTANRGQYGYSGDVLNSNIKLHASSSPTDLNKGKSPEQREIMVNTLTLTSGASAPLFVKVKDANGNVSSAKRFISMKESSYRTELNRYKGIIKMVRNVDIFYNFIHKSLNEMYTRYIKGERECFRYVMKKINAIKDIYSRYFFILNSSKVNCVSRIENLNKLSEFFNGLNTSLQTLARSDKMTDEFINIINTYDAEINPAILFMEQDIQSERAKGNTNATQEEILRFCKKIGTLFKSKDYSVIRRSIIQNNIVSEVRAKIQAIEQELVKNKNRLEKFNEAKKNIGTTTMDVNTGKNIDNFLLLEDVTFNVKKVYIYLNLVYEYLTMDTTKQNLENELVDQTVNELKFSVDKIVKNTMSEYVRDISIDRIAYQYKFMYYKLFICELFKVQYFNEIVRIFEKYTVLQKMENIQRVWDIYEQYNEIQEILVFDDDDITPDDKGAIITFNRILLALTGNSGNMHSKSRQPDSYSQIMKSGPQSVSSQLEGVSKSVSDRGSESVSERGSERGSESVSDVGSESVPESVPESVSDVESERGSDRVSESVLSDDELAERLAMANESSSEIGSEDLQKELGDINPYNGPTHGGNKTTIDFLKLDVSKIKSELKKYSDKLSEVTSEKFTTLLSKLNKNITYDNLMNEIGVVYITGLYKDETIIKNIVRFFDGNYKSKIDELYKEILEPFKILNITLSRLNKIVNVLEFIKKRYITAFSIKKSSSLYVMPNDDFYVKYKSINKDVYVELIKDVNALNIDSAIDNLKLLASSILQKSSVPTNRVNFEALKSLLRHIVTNIQLLNVPLSSDTDKLFESKDKETLTLYLISTMSELRNAEKELQLFEYAETLERQEEQRMKPQRDREEKERRQKEQQAQREKRDQEQQAQREQKDKEQQAQREKRDQETQASLNTIRDLAGGSGEDMKSKIAGIKNNLSKLQSLLNKPNVPVKEEDDYLKNKDLDKMVDIIKIINKVQLSNRKIAIPTNIKPPSGKISLTGSELQSMLRDSTTGGFRNKSKRRVMYRHRHTRKSRS